MKTLPEYDTFHEKFEHYESVRSDLDLDAIWSIFEIDNLNKPHPYAAAKTITHENHLGGKPITRAIVGSTYAALYMAANACIRDSGDGFHVFIEGFSPRGETLVLHVGS